MKMEQEHMIIVGLLVVIAVLSYYTFKECESCKKSTAEGFGLDLPIDASAHIRMREGYGIPGDANEAATAAHIRNNMNNSFQQSSHVTHHLRRDHRNKMMRNMMFGQ